jgi:Pyruvate/2-oxoacid:ferredoxin oxidoreductase gamma subunit
MYNDYFEIPDFRHPVEHILVFLMVIIVIAAFIFFFALIVLINEPVPVKTVVQEKISQYLDSRRTKLRVNNMIARSSVRDVPLMFNKHRQDHTHGKSASRRSAASDYMERYAESQGLTPYFVQSSRTDAKKNRQGSRTHFWAKDFNSSFRPMSITQNDAVILVDVDYYMDMPRLMSTHPTLYLIYGVQPSRAAKTADDYKYTFADNRIHYYVNGSDKPYVHEIWNYQADVITVVSPLTFTTYNVERIPVDDDHQIVILVPLVKFTYISAILARNFMEYTLLTRWKMCTEKHVRISTKLGEELVVSTAKEGDFSSHTIPHSNEESIKNLIETGIRSGKPVAVSQIAQNLQVIKHIKVAPMPAAHVLLSYYSLDKRNEPVALQALPDHTIHYTFVRQPLESMEPRNTMVEYAKPFLDGACVPQSTESNDIQMIESRVHKPQEASRRLTEPSKFLIR